MDGKEKKHLISSFHVDLFIKRTPTHKSINLAWEKCIGKERVMRLRSESFETLIKDVYVTSKIRL